MLRWPATAALPFAALSVLAQEAARPIVIAHRGASGHRPEHTLEAYSLGIEMGADFIEPDLVPTKDGHFVARHENEISTTTDVASRPEFAARRATKSVDGQSVSGWFTEDFTLAELKTLRARERMPLLRPNNTAFDGKFEIPTLDEVIALAARRGKQRGRAVGIYPELKHPTYFAGLGLPGGKALVEILHRHGLRGPNAPVFIQCFEVGPLRELRAITELPLVQLIEDHGRPWDFVVGRFGKTYADLITPAGLRDIKAYARGIGIHKNWIAPRGPDGRLQPTTNVVRDAHSAGLLVHVWTMRNEDSFLPVDFHGNPGAEYALFLKLGVDGLFSDYPDAAVRARESAGSSR
jgi:glycerophosphoryl diester phosphodiesterase